MRGPVRLTTAALLALAIGAGTQAALPQSATASPLCTAASWVSGIAGKACDALSGGSKVISAGKKLLSGHIGDAAKTLVGGGSGAAGRALGLAAIGAWVISGASAALHATVALLGHTTSPQLETTWFSGRYWRIAGVAAVLTLPFLFAAAIQALMRSDLALLLRASLGYLPLALLAVSVAAPVTMLLLAASDQLSAVVAGATGEQALSKAGFDIGVVSVVAGSPFLAFLLGLFLVVAAAAVWLELVIREAAVYVVVLMLPLTFAALVWPARRVWAVRTVELLVALILSKFAIVAVLSLAAAAVGHSVSGMIVVVALFTMAAFAPWALVRLFPLAELASGAASSIRGELARTRYGVVESRRGAERATGAIEGESDIPPEDFGPAPADREAARAERDGMQERRPMPVAAGGRNGATADSDGGTGAALESEAGAEAGESESDGIVRATGADPDPSREEMAADRAQASADEMRSRLRASLRTPVILGPEGVPDDPPADPASGGDPLPPDQEREDGLL